MWKEIIVSTPLLGDRGGDWIILFVAGLVAVGLAFHLWWRQARREWAHRGRAKRARQGEVKARRLLERAGYRILAEQVTRAWRFEVDGEETEVHARADFKVQDRKKRVFIAEVKTGAHATNPKTPATRRQLLEYHHAYPEADGLLLVDVDARRLIRVRFDHL